MRFLTKYFHETNLEASFTLSDVGDFAAVAAVEVHSWSANNTAVKRQTRDGENKQAFLFDVTLLNENELPLVRTYGNFQTPTSSKCNSFFTHSL